MWLTEAEREEGRGGGSEWAPGLFKARGEGGHGEGGGHQKPLGVTTLPLSCTSHTSNDPPRCAWRPAWKLYMGRACGLRPSC